MDYISLSLTVTQHVYHSIFQAGGKTHSYCSNSAISHETINILIVFSANFILQKLFSSLEMAYAKHTRNIF